MARILVLLALCVPGLCLAADAETLADIRAELQMLERDIATLRRELSTTSPATSEIADPAPIFQRLNALEAEAVRITADVEALRLEVDRIVRDGTNRIDDLDFRLTELEGGDLAALDAPAPLGEGVLSSGGADGARPSTLDTSVRPRPRDAAAAAPTSEPLPSQDPRPAATDPIVAAPETPPAPQLAVNERTDFDTAKRAFDTGNYSQAADQFAQFMQLYPGGPLNHEAAFWRGEALFEQGIWTGAARAYLDAFSGNPSGPKAADALLRLGTSLGRLGQTDEACLTLAEVGKRFPSAGAATVAGVAAEQRALSCS
ncbi:MAG: tol-pal system protein YbgF [Pseudomonadota bacterium]